MTDPEDQLLAPDAADRFLRLHRSLLARRSGDGDRLWVVVTSARAGEGVTTVARGLARAMAGAGDEAVYWRAPPGPLEPGPAPGGADGPPAESLRREGEDGRLYELELASGGAVAHAATARRLRDRFRQGVIDAAPVLSSSSCLRFAGLVDGAVLVVEAASTSWRLARQAAAALQSAGITPLGVVLNKALPDLPSRWGRLLGESFGHRSPGEGAR